MSWIHIPEYVGYPGGKVLFLVEPPSEVTHNKPTQELSGGQTVYIKYKRYNDGTVFQIPLRLEGGTMYTQVVKTVRLPHGEIWSPIGVSDEVLKTAVERYLAEQEEIPQQYQSVVERYLTEQEEIPQQYQPVTQSSDQSFVRSSTPPPVGEKKDNTWLWILGIVAVIVVIFLLKKR